MLDTITKTSTAKDQKVKNKNLCCLFKLLFKESIFFYQKICHTDVQSNKNLLSVNKCHQGSVGNTKGRSFKAQDLFYTMQKFKYKINL